jgi:hypothetical protein
MRELIDRRFDLVIGRAPKSEFQMARFYFHLRKMGQLTADDEGLELLDSSAALREAHQSARELLADAIRSGKDTVPDAFVIADEQGEIATLPLEELLPEPLKRK